MNPLRHTSVVPHDVADQFARDWIAAWNAHDLDRIVSHYRDDVLLVSPFAARAGALDGVLRGLPALRDYFARALALYTDLCFEPIAALSGVNSIALHYRSVEGREAIEVVELDARRQVHRVAAHYTAAPPTRTQ
jgi:hypothetical protein